MSDAVRPTCAELRERLDLLALGALDALDDGPADAGAADEAALRAHLDGCAACAARARGLEGAATRLAAAAPAPLAPDVRARVLARVGGAPGPGPAGPGRRPGWLAAAVVGATLVALAGHGQAPAPRPATGPPGPTSEVRPPGPRAVDAAPWSAERAPVAPLEPLGPAAGPVEPAGPDEGPDLVGPEPGPPGPRPDTGGADVAPVGSIDPTEASAADPMPSHLPDAALPVGK